MPEIIINGNVIEFPESGTQADWAPPVVDFAENVQDALNGLVGPADVSPQVYDISTHNGDGTFNIPSLAFSTAIVRSVEISYYSFRTTDTNRAEEQGKIMAIYNDQGTIGQKWNFQRETVGDGLITLTMTDTGQIQCSTVAMSGSNYSGKLGFSAKALLQD